MSQVSVIRKAVQVSRTAIARSAEDLVVLKILMQQPVKKCPKTQQNYEL